MNNLADYLYTWLDKTTNMTLYMEDSLNQINDLINAEYIDKDEFIKHFNLPEDSGLYTLITFIVANLNNESLINYGLECRSSRISK